MILFRYLFLSFFILVVNSHLLATQDIQINFKNLQTENFIKIVSKIIEKDILITSKIDGEVNFTSNKPITKKNILDILTYDLRSKGFSIVDKNNMLLVVNDENLSQYGKKKKFSSDILQVIDIKNSDSKLIVKILKDIISNTKDKNNAIKPYISLDAENNRLIVIGSHEAVVYVSNIITHLDTDKQQVYVQAKIIEISETKTKNIGLEYGLNGFNSTGSSLNTFTSSLNSITDVSSLSLSQLSGYGYGPNVLKSAISLGATINLLKENQALEVVSEPSILCVNNKESSIYVGETRSIPTGTTIGTTTTTNYDREDIGLRLTIKPRLSTNEKVTLEINTIIEDVKLGSSTNSIPNTNKKEVVTTAIVNNGENVIIGGLIKNKMETSEQKIPFLGDIPILGSLFKSNYDYEDKINLVIIITPYIVPKSKDLTYIRNQLAQLKIVEDQYTKTLKEKLLEHETMIKNKENNINQDRIDKILSK